MPIEIIIIYQQYFYYYLFLPFYFEIAIEHILPYSKKLIETRLNKLIPIAVFLPEAKEFLILRFYFNE